MADGTYKNIEQVKEGEWVVSYDTENNLKTISEVAHSLVHEDVEGYVIINGELEVTSNHPMWIVNRQEWAQVHTIKLEDILLDSNGKEIMVISLEDINGVNIVYNLELEGEHQNYFAGDILVHNKFPSNGEE
jgi:intein/homing endonuclease